MAQPQNLLAHLLIRSESPDQPPVRALLDELDGYLADLYAPQDNHILDLEGLLSPGVCFLVARLDAQVLGCAAYRRMPGEAATAAQAYAELKRMMVAPAARGHGIGGALLERIEAKIHDDGLRLALLETGAAQRQAVRLYERCGYVQRPPFAGYPDNGLSRFYEKRLTA